MATDKIDMTDLFDKFLTIYKETHVSINGQQVQTECSRLWREMKEKRMLQQNLKPKNLCCSGK